MVRAQMRALGCAALALALALALCVGTYIPCLRRARCAVQFISHASARACVCSIGRCWRPPLLQCCDTWRFVLVHWIALLFGATARRFVRWCTHELASSLVLVTLTKTARRWRYLCHSCCSYRRGERQQRSVAHSWLATSYNYVRRRNESEGMRSARARERERARVAF